MTVSNYSQIIGIFINIPSLLKFIHKLIKLDHSKNDKNILIKFINKFNNLDDDCDEIDFYDEENDLFYIEHILQTKIINNYINYEHKNLFDLIDYDINNKIFIKLVPHSYSDFNYKNDKCIIFGIKLQQINNLRDTYPAHNISSEPDIELINKYNSLFKLLFNNDFDLVNNKVKLFTVPDDCYCCS